MPLEQVELPPYEDGCQDDPEEVACDYPETQLKKIVSTDWAESDSTGGRPGQELQWTNDDQNQVAAYITYDGMSPEDAAAEVDRGQPGQGRRLARLSLDPHQDFQARSGPRRQRPAAGLS